MSTPAELPGQAALAARLLRDGRGVRMQVRGRSMAPTLRSGDVVELEPVARDTLRPGDIVLCPRTQGGWHLHRILRRAPRRDGWLQTRGDALWRLDDPVPAAAILGRVRVASRADQVVFRRRPLRDGFRAQAMLIASGLHQRSFRRSRAQ